MNWMDVHRYGTFPFASSCYTCNVIIAYTDLAFMVMLCG